MTRTIPKKYNLPCLHCLIARMLTGPYFTVMTAEGATPGEAYAEITSACFEVATDCLAWIAEHSDVENTILWRDGLIERFKTDVDTIIAGGYKKGLKGPPIETPIHEGPGLPPWWPAPPAPPKPTSE